MREWTQFRLRLPPSLHMRLKLNSVRERRTLNSEIVLALEHYARSIEQTKKAPGSRQANPDASHAE